MQSNKYLWKRNEKDYTHDLLLAFLQKKVDVVRIIRGRACTIQGSNSDILLYIPDGVYAALLGKIHSDPTKFRHHIPPNDCLVAPICEYHLQPFVGRILPRQLNCKLQVPHVVRNMDEVKKHIRVRHGDLHSNAVLPVYKLEKDKYEMDEKYMTIYASHFSGFIITAEAINCCSRRANVLLFGSLTNGAQLGALMTVTMYLSNCKSEIRDYTWVCTLHLFTVPQLFCTVNPFASDETRYK